MFGVHPLQSLFDFSCGHYCNDKNLCIVSLVMCTMEWKIHNSPNGTVSGHLPVAGRMKQTLGPAPYTRDLSLLVLTI